MLGEQHPATNDLTAVEQIAMQKAFFDHMWSLSLVEMMDHLDALETSLPSMAATAGILNRGNAEHAAAMRSFERVYREEINGVLELAGPISMEVLNQMAERAQIGIPPSPSNEVTGSALRLLRAAVKTQKGRRALRTWHIGAVLHAATRWNRTKKLVANDLFDFHHAEAAVAYCDAFFTDKPMHALLAQKHHGLLQEFPCQVASSVPDALTVTRSLLAQRGINVSP